MDHIVEAILDSYWITSAWVGDQNKFKRSIIEGFLEKKDLFTHIDTIDDIENDVVYEIYELNDLKVVFRDSEPKTILYKKDDEKEIYKLLVNDTMLEMKKIVQIKRMIRLLEHKTGKKVMLREFVEDEVAQSNSKVDRLQNLSAEVEGIMTQISELIQDETETDEGFGDEELTEDVRMTMDQITKKPDTVKKLGDKKINVDLVDPDDPQSIIDLSKI